MGKRTPYSALHLIPEIVAEQVCQEVYTGQEISDKLRSSEMTRCVEKLRRAMTQNERQKFVQYCGTRCRRAYEVRAKWFEGIVKAGGDTGLKKLYGFVRHWMGSYLLHPELWERDPVSAIQRCGLEAMKAIGDRLGERDKRI